VISKGSNCSRHCERSEAIQTPQAPPDRFGALRPAMTVDSYPAAPPI
jgi:hypothetical protein